MFSASSLSNQSQKTPHVLFEKLLNFDDCLSIFSGLMETVYDYVSIYNKNMTLLDCSKSCLDLLRNEKKDMHFVAGKHFNVLVPDFKKRNLYKEFRLANDRNGYFELDSFPLHNPSIYSDTTYVHFRLIYRDPYIISCATDMTVNIQYDVLKRKYLNLLAKNEQLESFLSSTTKNEMPSTNTFHAHLDDNKIKLPKLLDKQKDFTEREIEIAMLIIEGLTTREIADVLYLSTKTIDFHRINIRKKLGITNSKKSLSSHLLSL
ncbi:LuxR C-terminal-related transcriptional regulator [Acetobacterium wieringae]|uniref:LuxR C-terminal-related transcriptional regulator n=1 Tax=Acetobacterium wieringae TaxID=52694 RepID=A0ABY6HK98_9FIRM|nr:LuxR C-terminal-related transcriptional regulator [Acetobacterium wieringae]UYO63973.1 LuxR C-terminal-related transcriptional regulator [Acetobacterium wieringae]